MLPTPLLALLALSSFEVEGGGSCPDPEAVKARLAELSIEGAHVVQLRVLTDRLQVRLLDARGALVGERDLMRNSSCEELAEATAVLVSAWTIDVPALELPALEPETTLAATTTDPAPGDAPKSSLDLAPPAPPPITSPPIAAP